MKVVLFSLLALCFFCNKDKIEVIDAYSQEWIAGQQDGNNGTNYMFTVAVLKSSKHLEFKELWIGDEKISFKVFNNRQSTNDLTFAKNDTIFLRGQIITNNYLFDKNKNNDITPEKPPIEYTGEALIVYSYHCKQKYFVVTDIEKKKKLMHP